MDLLVTLIGNAAVDPIFREKFLADPLATADLYGFRLTKGEVELMEKVFTKELKDTFEKQFKGLEEVLYTKFETGGCRKPPCQWTIYPPTELRGQYVPEKKAKAA